MQANTRGLQQALCCDTEAKLSISRTRPRGAAHPHPPAGAKSWLAAAVSSAMSKYFEPLTARLPVMLALLQLRSSKVQRHVRVWLVVHAACWERWQWQQLLLAKIPTARCRL